LQRATALQNENEQLRALLQSAEELSHSSTLVARLIAVSRSNYYQSYSLNKGFTDGVYSGQAVLDSYGVFGQIISPGYNTSKVLLITDSRVSVHVQSSRNNLRGIVKGSGQNGELSLTNMPTNSDIAIGDLFFTSGLDGKYPYGYPVGKVISIDNGSGNGFANIKLLPSANLHSSNLLLLLDPVVEKKLG
ncbi:MAG: rod shape-determining protein MreC, partial [Legionellales bacterium]|nr:rod shape-determining protein MreC [Legionellales bacterium]